MRQVDVAQHQKRLEQMGASPSHLLSLFLHLETWRKSEG